MLLVFQRLFMAYGSDPLPHGPSGPAPPASPMPAAPAPAIPASQPVGQKAVYTCPMHPEVISNSPGKCPKCGMELVPREAHGKFRLLEVFTTPIRRVKLYSPRRVLEAVREHLAARHDAAEQLVAVAELP